MAGAPILLPYSFPFAYNKFTHFPIPPLPNDSNRAKLSQYSGTGCYQLPSPFPCWIVFLDFANIIHHNCLRERAQGHSPLEYSKYLHFGDGIYFKFHLNLLSISAQLLCPLSLECVNRLIPPLLFCPFRAGGCFRQSPHFGPSSPPRHIWPSINLCVAPSRLLAIQNLIKWGKLHIVFSPKFFVMKIVFAQITMKWKMGDLW